MQLSLTKSRQFATPFFLNKNRFNTFLENIFHTINLSNLNLGISDISNNDVSSSFINICLSWKYSIRNVRHRRFNDFFFKFTKNSSNRFECWILNFVLIFFFNYTKLRKKKSLWSKFLYGSNKKFVCCNLESMS